MFQLVSVACHPPGFALPGALGSLGMVLEPTAEPPPCPFLSESGAARARGIFQGNLMTMPKTNLEKLSLPASRSMALVG